MESNDTPDRGGRGRAFWKTSLARSSKTASLLAGRPDEKTQSYEEDPGQIADLIHVSSAALGAAPTLFDTT